MDNTCRLCSVQSTALTSAFSLKNGRIIADMVSIICPIKIDISDNFPKSICTSCTNIVFDAVNLREKSIQSDQNFRTNGPPLVYIKEEQDPFHQELWIENDSINEEVGSESEECPSNYEDNDTEYYPEMMVEIKSEKSQTSVSAKTEKRRKRYGPGSCSLCGLKLAHSSNVRRHMMRYHDPSLPIACKKCPCRFKNEVRLRGHMESMHSVRRVKIQKIHAQEDPELEEPKELTNKHQSILCDLCGKEFTNRTLLERHLTVTHREKDKFITNNEDEANFQSGCYPCNLCTKSFTMRHNLNRHYKRFHSTDLTFQCTQCNDRFRTDIHLKRHILRVHENHNGIFNKIIETEPSDEGLKGEEIFKKCQYCDQEFNGSKYRYEQHMILMHEKELVKIYSCDICPKKFVLLKSLKHHVEVHRKRAREENFPFQCDVCLRKFLDEEKFKRHTTYAHAGPSSFVCYLCGKTLDSRKKYNYHMLRHQDIRNHQCSKCGTKFLQARHLRRHLITHSDARPFVCTQVGCGKAFKVSDVLKKHLRNVHQIDNAAKNENIVH